MANQRGETTSIGHFYNRCVDAVNNLFDTMSFWTHSKDVEFVDGKTAETKVGAINGITSDMSGEADDIAASIKCVNELNNSLGGLKFGVDENGNYGYIKDGADTVTPFSSGSVTMSFSGGCSGSTTLTNVNSIDFSESNYSYESGSTNPYISLYGFKNDVSTTIFTSSIRPINKYDVSEYDYIVIMIGNAQGDNYQTYINNVLVEFS